MNSIKKWIVLTIIALLAGLSARPAMAQKFAPITPPSDGVVFPMPAVELPKGMIETESSPQLSLAKGYLALAEAQKAERSQAAEEAQAKWKKAIEQQGVDSQAARQAHADFLTRYASDLGIAIVAYKGTVAAVQGIDAVPEGNPETDPVAAEAAAQIEAAKAEQSLVDAACIIDPNGCLPPDPDNARIAKEIASLSAQLDGSAQDGAGLDHGSLIKKANLLLSRAELMRKLVRRAAAKLATDVVTQRDGQGHIKPLPSPLAPSSRNTAASPIRYKPGDPYQR